MSGSHQKITLCWINWFVDQNGSRGDRVGFRPPPLDNPLKFLNLMVKLLKTGHGTPHQT